LEEGVKKTQKESPWVEGKREVLRHLEIGSTIYLLIAILLGIKFGNREILIGILTGGGIALLNFRAWQWLIQNLIQKKPMGKSATIFFMMGKTALPFGLIGLAIWVFHIHILGILLGLSSIVGSLFVFTFWATVKYLMKTHITKNKEKI